MNQPHGPSVLFVLPSYGGGAAAIDAASITCADLADALGARLGGAEMLTPNGLCTPAEVRANAVRPQARPSGSRSAFARLPQDVRVALSDVRDWRRAVALRRTRPPGARRYRLVVQLHGKHHDAGQRIAKAVGAPFVLRLDALEIREEASWGIRRPGWGTLVERKGEFDILRRSDLVASVSATLDAHVAEAGIPALQRLVLPNGVDVTSFAPADRDQDGAFKSAHGLEGRFVVGWVGGFRPFHGLEMIPEIARRLRSVLPQATLCLVGAGPERDGLRARTREMGDTVRIIDAVPHQEVPRWISAFDASLVLAGEGGFHYSPMKLYEYMACGRPVVAPAIGQVDEVIGDGRNGLLVPPGDPAAVVEALRRLEADPALAERLGSQARITALHEATWDERARALIERLEERGLLATDVDNRRASTDEGVA